jgi:DNA-binding XRE family transcriptional regulator
MGFRFTSPGSCRAFASIFPLFAR